MYGLVVMAALTVGGEQTPNWFFHGCHGCSGCWGGHGCHGSCYGGCYGGCYGYCYGGWGCSGSCSGCYGGCSGCYGGCAGAYAGCWGAGYGCYGSCYGGGCAGYFSPAYAPIPVGGMPLGGMPISSMPVSSEPAPPPSTERPKKKGAEDDDSTSASARARLIVELPAGARLFVDDRPVTAEGRRTFRTPELEPGATYYYEVRAEMMRDGERVTETRRVTVRAGQVVREDFRNLLTRAATPATATASSR